MTRSALAAPNALPAGVRFTEARTILTPASGFIKAYRYTLNPYSGCRFACEYCYARAFAPTENLRRTWGEWASAKRNAATLIARACADGTLRSGDAVYMSSATDPYQPAEQRLRITRSILETMLEWGVQPRLTVQTRSPIAARDIELFQRFERVRVNITVTTDSERVRLRYEPSAPAIKTRLRTARGLVEAGVPIGISVSPMLPMDDLEGFAREIAALEAAKYVSQYMQPPSRVFSAGTRVETLRMAREDGWTPREYARARTVIESVLGPRRPLLEGDEGFAPVPRGRRLHTEPPWRDPVRCGPPIGSINRRTPHMSGSSESNEELVAGRVNRSNDQTTIWAENRYVETGILGGLGGEEFRIEFGGNPIFLVEVARDSEEDGDFLPPNPLEGIVARGWSAEHTGQSGGTGVVAIGGPVEGTGARGIGGANGSGVTGDAGGRASGVVGLGGPVAGTGVVGIGSGGERNLGPHMAFDARRGRGGVGVWGLGGLADLDRPSQAGQPPAPDVLPGTGVLGQGGKIDDRNGQRMLLGPGVVGIGGSAGDPERPTMNDAGSAGVFGQGATARIRTEIDGGNPVLVGPAEAGPGVVGIGGVPEPREFPVGAGVIGLAGGETRPGINETGETGVYGRGRTGMRAQGLGGPGVLARSDHDRGGVFEAGNGNAQVLLVPNQVRTRLPEETGITPTALSPAAVSAGVVALPRDGRGGDLAAIEDLTGRCTLWFCVESVSGSGPATWAQVLLGPMFDGTS